MLYKRSLTTLFSITLLMAAVLTGSACNQETTDNNNAAAVSTADPNVPTMAENPQPNTAKKATTSPQAPQALQPPPQGPVFAVAMHGTPKYNTDFKQLDYVNPKAPKGGSLRLGDLGTYDNFNPFISKGTAPGGIGLLYQSLTTSTLQEAFTEYGLIAKTLEIAPDRSAVTFTLNPKAKFDDGKPITAEDVVFSFNILVEKGAPHYQYYYASVKMVEALSPQVVRFSFKPGENRELPLIMGQLPILAKHYWEKREFNKTTLDIPVGNGPYRIKSYDVGRSITYERNPHYWAAELPINKGRYNFNEITYNYFMDTNIALEAFKSGDFDLRVENTSKLWATQYQGPMFSAAKNPHIIKQNLKHQAPQGMQGFAFNLRKPMLQDPILRQAMGYAFDFEWANKHLFYGQYTRTHSFFQNTELAASKPISQAEREVLEPVKDQVAPEVFTQVYTPPKTDGKGKSRRQLRAGLNLLKKAGYTIENNQLKTPQGKPVVIDFLVRADSQFDRIILPFKKQLAVLGITLNLKKVDSSQYLERRRRFDFDMIVASFGQSLSPGNEQRDFWHSTSADKPDSRNLLGLKNPAVDYLVDQIIAAPSRQDLITRTRALDRVLQWQYLVIPNWHIAATRVAYWNKLQPSLKHPKYGIDLYAWWTDPQAATAN